MNSDGALSSDTSEGNDDHSPKESHLAFKTIIVCNVAMFYSRVERK